MTRDDIRINRANLRTLIKFGFGTIKQMQSKGDKVSDSDCDKLEDVRNALLDIFPGVNPDLELLTEMSTSLAGKGIARSAHVYNEGPIDADDIMLYSPLGTLTNISDNVGLIDHILVESLLAEEDHNLVKMTTQFIGGVIDTKNDILILYSDMILLAIVQEIYRPLYDAKLVTLGVTVDEDYTIRLFTEKYNILFDEDYIYFEV